MNIRLQRKHLIGISFVTAIGLWWILTPRPLNGDNTVHDYMTAPTEKAVRWFSQMCDGGQCLHPTDWSCGFSIPNATDEQARQYDDAVKNCFSNALKRAKSWDKLDKLRQICGRQWIVFVGEPHGSKAECERKGRIWGDKAFLDINNRKVELYTDQDTYLNR